MKTHEARWLALLIAWDDLTRSLDTSDEWCRHPETDEPFSRDEMLQIKAEGRRLAEELRRRAERLLTGGDA